MVGNITVPLTGCSWDFCSVDTALVDFQTSLMVVDSIGFPHHVHLYFIHTEPGVWTWEAFIRSEEIDPVWGGLMAIGAGALEFAPDGLLSSADGGTLSLEFYGASPQVVSIDFGAPLDSEGGDGSGSANMSKLGWFGISVWPSSRPAASPPVQS